MRRRDVFKLGLAAGGAGIDMKLGTNPLLQFLCPPDGEPPDLAQPSPPARPFVAELFVPPVAQPLKAELRLDPPPDPRAHQRYDEFPPQKLYELREQELLWQYHPDPPYDKGSWSWGFNGTTPGPAFHAHYGEPVLVRRFNTLPTVGNGHVGFALPSTSAHLHNGHTASESDGSPQDWIDSGEFWDHHYANFPSGHDPREKLATLWYHDHRLDFTAANVYAGLAGFYLLFDDQDTGDENDPSPRAWRLPSGKYDVPLLLHDILFTEDGQVRWSPFNTDGILGDRYTVNRRIQPFFKVEARKYRFRIINGGPSRFYQLFLSSGDPFIVITGDGNFLPNPVLATSLFMSVAQRFDVVIDFSHFKPGDTVELVNRLAQFNGKGPSGRMLDPGDPILQFQVVPAVGKDPSRVPTKFRELPAMQLDEVKVERTWVFDYDGGLWTINGKVMDANRIDAGVELGAAEIWTFRNGGNSWSHPVHCHFTEFMMLEINGKPYKGSYIQQWGRFGELKFIEALKGGAESGPGKGLPAPAGSFFGGPRRDVATLLPGDEIKVYIRFRDFLGKYVMHCHNVVHEDHSMMIRWDIVEPGKGFVGSRPASEVYGTPEVPPHLEERPTTPTPVADQNGSGHER